MSKTLPKKFIGTIKPVFTAEYPKESIEAISTDYKRSQFTQKIHFLSLKATATDGYEQALRAMTGKIVAMVTTSQHLIVITE